MQWPKTRRSGRSRSKSRKTKSTSYAGARRRRGPDKDTVSDRSRGVQLAKLRPLVEYWGSGYEWRKIEAMLNELPQFITKLDKGGHFAAWEQPQLFSEEVRAALRSLR
jgi:hypothetical protein